MPLCLASASLSVALSLQAFTLAWTHSIEKVRWEEDWRVENGRLILVEARVVGTGAGMEPGPGAVLRDGAWHYTPDLPALERVKLTHSPYTAGYQLCAAGQCRALADYLPGIADTAVVELSACPAPP